MILVHGIVRVAAPTEIDRLARFERRAPLLFELRAFTQRDRHRHIIIPEKNMAERHLSGMESAIHRLDQVSQELECYRTEYTKVIVREMKKVDRKKLKILKKSKLLAEASGPRAVRDPGAAPRGDASPHPGSVQSCARSLEDSHP